MRYLFLTIISFLFINISISQTENKSSLKLAEIMKGKDFIGYWPEYHYWHLDGEQILFNWNPYRELDYSLYSYSTVTKKTTKVDNANPHAGIAYDSEQSQFENQYYTTEGDLWVWNKKSKKCKSILSSAERISNVIRLKNKNKIVYKRGNNLFLYDASLGSTKQLTLVSKGAKPISSETEKDNITKQQEDLFLFIRESNEKKAYDQKKQSNNDQKGTLWLDGKNIDFLGISKDGNFAFIACGDYPKTKETRVEHHITTDGHTESKSARPKVGHPEPSHFFYIHDIEKDSIIKVDFSSLPDIRKKPEFLKEYGDFEENYKEDRKIVFHSPISSNSGKTVMDIRSYDNKDRWIVELNMNSYGFKVIEHQHDKAWIGGPGISYWNRGRGVLGFWKNDAEIYFQSEESGYSHLYTYNFQNGKRKQLTEGNFEVHNVTLSKDRKTFYLTTNTTHPGNREFHKFEADKNKWTGLLTQDGAYNVELSPDENSLAVLYSDKTHPNELFTGKNETKIALEKITESRTEIYQNHDWQSPEIITFLGEDNKKVNARLYQPKKENKNNAAVVFVHGAGYLQNAHNFWSGYYREFMFHNMLIDNGYTVLDIDFRASKGYGRDHRTAIYRHMGGWDLQDNITGKNLLVDSLNIDPNRVGIYGGSYGGFITLMALLTRPDEFTCGAALRSVTDWRHYNHEYTSNILNYPDNDSLAYWRSSPIYFAENLTKPLLILHGMVDDNVQFQDVVRLSQRFIELGKKDWEVALFPVEAHGFKKAYSWTDEYRRIFELFQEELNPPK